MRGGSRYGAGRPGRKGKVESLLNIDVRQWARRGLLVPGNYFGWHWSREDERIASIGVRINDAYSVTLEYTHTPDGEPPQNISRHIRLESTVCNFGGNRVWFRCPHTGRRVAKLYLLRGQWYCRKSLTVAYTSQSEDLIGRMWRRKRKIEGRLGEYLVRPKGMHSKTHERLVEKWNDAEMRLDYDFMVRGAKMFGWPLPV